ncbi:lysophospholipid acyltransferase family protein [Roseicitreum antarcticum]|uniref:KDO2-lipid IV(A) lauroyltransferase n=1 Tax=Roseicitreum antarcticum TaxID=564137 RepID=A0A1H2VSD0_9RHOB|nr:lysophospholipid acyltransferase family protein [Roseicitreum antarcticum]SDW71293.1 KDO2-lipid IV(A) lauroyltransferase [Roseicitreum antarcticum]
MSKSRFQTITHVATDLAVRSVLGLAKLLPYRWRVPLVGWFVARVFGPLAGWPRRVRNNLAHVMPDLPEAEVNRLTRAVPDNVGRTLMEIYSGHEFIRHAASNPVRGPGLAALQQARADGRAVILVTAHMGNYDAVRAHLVAAGYPMGALYRRMTNPYFNKHYVRAISTIGTPMFKQGRRGMMQLVKHLRGGGTLGILTDLAAMDGALIPFLGRPAWTSLVTAEMALKYDAVLIPAFALRDASGLGFDIQLQEPIPHTDPMAMTIAINERVEALVRAHPEQWFWVHRRWKGPHRSSA